MIVLVGGVAGADRIGIDLQGHRPVDILTPGVLALAVMSTAFTVGGDRRPASSAATA